MGSSSSEGILDFSFPNATTDSTNSLTSTNILNWIHTLQTPPQISQHSLIAPYSDIQYLKRRRTSDSIPSEFLADAPSSRKRRKALETMTENGNAQGSRQFSTPSRKAKASTGQDDDSQGAANKFMTPTKASAQRKLTFPSQIGVQMEDHGLLFEDCNALEGYSGFVEKVKEIVLGNRWSTMKPESAKRFRNYHRYYARMNENTLLSHCFPILMANGYHKMESSEEYHAEGMEKDRQTYVDYLEDEGIAETMNHDFHRTLVPSRFDKKSDKLLQEMAKALAKTPGMENPRPDYTFGHRIDRIPKFKVPMPRDVTDLLELAPGMHNAFLVVEAKGDAGSVAEAENQLRRAGATLVNGARLLRTKVGDNLITEGPDDSTFVFGATFSPQAVEIYVHWYDAGTEYYHMNFVETYGIKSDKQLQEGRKALHNILQWGANDRYFDQESLRRQIERYAERVDEEKRTKKKRKGSDGATELE